jgi:hypothetical protein
MLHSCKEVRQFDGESGEEGISLYTGNWSHIGGKDGLSVWRRGTALCSPVTHPWNRFYLDDSRTECLGVKLNPTSLYFGGAALEL